MHLVFFFNETLFITVNILGIFSIPNISFLNGGDRIASLCEVLTNLRFLQRNMAAIWFTLFFPLNSIKVSAPNFLYSPLSITEHLGSCCWGAWRDISPSFKSLAGCTSGQLSGMNSLTKDWKKPHLSPMELTCYHQCRCYLQRKYKLEGILVSRFF